jgi:toxin YoeB
MDKRITWTENALREKVAILKYWKERNKSNRYSEKLNHLFKNTLKTLQKHPSLGK